MYDMERQWDCMKTDDKFEVKLTLAMYVDSAGTAPHKGGAFAPGVFPIYSGSVWAVLSNIFINAPRRIVSLFPAFRAYTINAL